MSTSCHPSRIGLRLDDRLLPNPGDVETAPAATRRMRAGDLPQARADPAGGPFAEAGDTWHRNPELALPVAAKLSWLHPLTNQRADFVFRSLRPNCGMGIPDAVTTPENLIARANEA